MCIRLLVELDCGRGAGRGGGGGGACCGRGNVGSVAEGIGGIRLLTSSSSRGGRIGLASSGSSWLLRADAVGEGMVCDMSSPSSLLLSLSLSLSYLCSLQSESSSEAIAGAAGSGSDADGIVVRGEGLVAGFSREIAADFLFLFSFLSVLGVDLGRSRVVGAVSVDRIRSPKVVPVRHSRWVIHICS
jgi:hypothetical protein